MAAERCGAINDAPGPNVFRGGILIRDDSRESPATDIIKGGTTDLRLVRLRLFLALLMMFAIPIAITVPVLLGQARGEAASLLPPTLAIIALAVVLGLLTVWLAHRVLEPAERLDEALRTLEGAVDQARSEALLDHLTGLGNHRAYQEEIERQWATASRHNRPLALALLDLDEFKGINDTEGHAAGDLLLRRTGSMIRAMLRRGDRAFRVGGDEFAIILPETGADGAHVVGRRLLASCLDAGVRHTPVPSVSSWPTGGAHSWWPRGSRRRRSSRWCGLSALARGRATCSVVRSSRPRPGRSTSMA